MTLRPCPLSSVLFYDLLVLAPHVYLNFFQAPPPRAPRLGRRPQSTRRAPPAAPTRPALPHDVPRASPAAAAAAERLPAALGGAGAGEEDGARDERGVGGRVGEPVDHERERVRERARALLEPQ